jgi:hypothetical protein
LFDFIDSLCEDKDMKTFFGFNKKELAILERLDSPKKIQNYIDKLQINFEEEADTCRSPRQVLHRRSAHCVEGALLAAVSLWYHGQKPLLLDLKTIPNDDEHVVALFQIRGYWGAISKTNHAVLRYREPIYRTVRELAMSYFHEYFKNSGQKTLRSYSKPFDLSKIKDKSWMLSGDNLWDLVDSLDSSKHYPFLNKYQEKNLRKADKIEIEAGKLVEYKVPKKK